MRQSASHCNEGSLLPLEQNDIFERVCVLHGGNTGCETQHTRYVVLGESVNFVSSFCKTGMLVIILQNSYKN